MMTEINRQLGEWIKEKASPVALGTQPLARITGSFNLSLLGRAPKSAGSRSTPFQRTPNGDAVR